MDRNDWNAPWFDKSRWIFSHLEGLEITTGEALLLLVINSLNELHQPITMDALLAKCHMDETVLDEMIEMLTERGYLSVEQKNRELVWRLDGLLEPGSAPQPAMNADLIEQFGRVFGRPLSGMEMERILQLDGEYEQSMILRALDEAAVYESLSVGYVEKVLAAWRARGLSAEDIEDGKR